MTINVEEEEPESLQELANRVREVTAMRLCDRQGDTQLDVVPESGSPTEVVEDLDVEMVFESPLEALKNLV